MADLERIVRFEPGYDRRITPEGKNYGVHGMQIHGIHEGTIDTITPRGIEVNTGRGNVFVKWRNVREIQKDLLQEGGDAHESDH